MRPLISHFFALTTGLCISTAAIAHPKHDVYMNQWGFSPEQSKLAIIDTGATQQYSVTALKNNETVLTGQTTGSGEWPAANKQVSIADISDITAPGEYRLTLEDGSTHIFMVRRNVLAEIHDAAVKAYYFGRSAMALDPAYAGKWHREAGHPDTETFELARPDAPARNRSKGWYDAGDYNKYVVNSGITTYTLLRAYLDFPEFYQTRRWNIPESANATPDILDEIAWNLDWLVTMQADDGGVYHKLTTKNFSGAVMPHAATEPRYVTAKSTAATLNFAAVMAVAARVYDDKKDAYLSHAKRALDWAAHHHDNAYKNEADIATGEYGDEKLADEHTWAAVEYALTTGDKKRLNTAIGDLSALSTPSWANVTGLSYLSLVSEGKSLLDSARYNKLVQATTDYADKQSEVMASNAFAVPISEPDFVWGSNAVMMNKAMLLEKAYALSQKEAYRQGALALVDYIAGRNPTGYSFVTGFGQRSPLFIHHRPSQADNVADPVPGWLAGGPQNGHQDKCAYPSSMPATSYIDDWCSYSTNEIAINWNAPLVYVLASLSAQPE